MRFTWTPRCHSTEARVQISRIPFDATISLRRQRSIRDGRREPLCRETGRRGETVLSLPQFPISARDCPSPRRWVWPSGRPMRRLIWASMACLGVYAATAWFLRPWDPVNPHQYYRIRLGMSERDAREVIGLPPGRYQSFRPIGGMGSPGQWGNLDAQSGLSIDVLPSGPRNGIARQAADGRMIRVLQWWGDSYAIEVAIDESGFVVGRYLIAVDTTHLEELREAARRLP